MKNIDKITDRLEKTIDKGIKETVSELTSLGFITTGSCEGHLKWGMVGPWVDITEKNINIWYEKEIQSIFDKYYISKEITEQKAWDNLAKKLKTAKYKELKTLQKKEEEKLIIILGEFYRIDRLNVSKSVKLHVVGGIANFRLESVGNKEAEEKFKKKAEFREKSLSEMKRFTKFLKGLNL